jgi:hypothetical protein
MPFDLSWISLISSKNCSDSGSGRKSCGCQFLLVSFRRPMSCCFKIEFFPGEREREKEKEVSTEHTSGARVVSANNNKERARGKNVKHQYASRLKARLPKFNFLSLPSLWGRRHGNFRDTNFSRSLSRSLLFNRTKSDDHKRTTSFGSVW